MKKRYLLAAFAFLLLSCKQQSKPKLETTTSVTDTIQEDSDSIEAMASKAYEEHLIEFRKGFTSKDKNYLFPKPKNLDKVLVVAFADIDSYLDDRKTNRINQYDSIKVGKYGTRYFYKELKSTTYLSEKGIEDLFELVNDTTIYNSTATCFNPHHGFYFINKQGVVTNYYEICFGCEDMASDPSFHTEQVRVLPEGLIRFRKIINDAGIDTNYYDF